MLTKPNIEKYFNAEKKEKFILILLGAVSIGLSFIGIYLLKNEFWKGAAFPLTIIGLYQITKNYIGYRRNDDDLLRVLYSFEINPIDIKQQELPRMIVINKNYSVYKWIKIVLIAIGFGCMFYNKTFLLQSEEVSLKTSFAFGLGCLLSLQSITMLIANILSEKRAAIYTKQLHNFVERFKKVA